MGVAPALEDEDDLVPISALQHMLFCPRQCALIHVERQWRENLFTAEGRLMHERPDAGVPSSRRGVRTLRSVPLRSRRLGLFGVADVVEVHGRARRPLPVEYKRGRPKSHRADEVQLCAQGLCLEEMLKTDIAEGALFYGEERRRTTVAFDTELRGLTEATAAQVHAMIAAGTTPAPIYDRRRCISCSLIDLCQPKRLHRAPPVAAWLSGQLTRPD